MRCLLHQELPVLRQAAQFPFPHLGGRCDTKSKANTSYGTKVFRIGPYFRRRE